MNHLNLISSASLDPRLYWVGDGYFWRKFLNCKSLGESVLVDSASRVFNPFLHYFSFPERGYQCVVSSVSGLLLSCSKTAVIWGVITEVIDAIKREFFGVTIGKAPALKSSKIVSPFMVHGNSSATVASVVLRPFVIAAVSYVTPIAVEKRVCSAFHLAFSLPRCYYA